MVAFEGLDGAGKSTQIQALTDALVQQGREVRQLRLNANPFFKTLCRGLNEHDLIDPTRASLMKASELSGRFEGEIKSRLGRGAVILWDKYIASSLAYDAARGVAHRDLAAIYSSLPAAKIIVYMEITPEEALRRKRMNGGPRLMESGLDLYLDVTVREAFSMMERGAVTAKVMDEAFLAFQHRVAKAYEDFLPSDSTVRFDGLEPADRLSANILQAVLSGLASAAPK
jgi:dTMP kinase